MTNTVTLIDRTQFFAFVSRFAKDNKKKEANNTHILFVFLYREDHMCILYLHIICTESPTEAEMRSNEVEISF